MLACNVQITVRVSHSKEKPHMHNSAFGFHFHDHFFKATSKKKSMQNKKVKQLHTSENICCAVLQLFLS